MEKNKVVEIFRNGLHVTWNSEYLCNQGSRLVAGVTVEGQYAEAVFKLSGGSTIFQYIFGLSKKMADAFEEGLKISVGTWVYQPGNGSDHQVIVNRLPKSNEDETRNYNHKVYFWVQEWKGSVRYCHSHDLCSTPMGRQAYEEWVLDKRGYMLRHPELCSNLDLLG